MYSNFREQAIEYVKQAVQEDNAGNYSKAFPLYMNALEYLKTHLKYEKNPEIKEAIEQKFTEYLRRAEEIRAVLDDGRTGPAANGDAAVATKPKTKPKDGEGCGDGDGDGDGEDPEQAKLRSGLNNSAIVEQMCSNFEQTKEYVKQAVQEDNAGNYSKAFPLYMNALEYFKTHLKYEKNPEIKEAIEQKFTEYLRRAEEIRAVLDDGRTGPAANGDAAVATKPKTKPKDGEGCGDGDGDGDGEDPEQAKLRSGLNSAIVEQMCSSFEQTKEYVKQAVQEDNAGNYSKAFPLYMSALEYFKTQLKYEKNPKIKGAITQKFTEYLRRAGEIRAVLDDGRTGPAENGDAAVATKPKTKPKDGEGGGDGEDPEQAKLRSGLNSAIVEKMCSSFKEQAIEYVKQAIQEDNAGNYCKAFPLYMNALEYFKAHLKYVGT